MFSNDSKLKQNEKLFRKSLHDINNYFQKLNKENKITSDNKNNDLFNNKIEYVDNYVYNAIVNHANKIYRKQIKESSSIKTNDIIQEIILRNYKKNRKQSRLNILDNYLKNTRSNKFKNKTKIKQAVKVINDELEEAQKEFRKLFECKDKII